jgi:dienelactone hydrolase
MHAIWWTCALVLADLPPTDHTGRAKLFVDQLNRGEFAKAVEPFDAKMQEVMPPDKLKQTWESLNKQLGAFKEAGGTRTEMRGKYEMVFVACTFEKMKFDMRVAFDSDHKIAGFAFQPPKPPVDYKAPDYVKPDAFKESEVALNAGGEWPLTGTLSMPAGAGPFPAVVFVHGSGSHDRDESLGSNKPFRDLAGGLASRGVAVLRYDKRNFIHGPKIDVAKFTIQEEVLDDALAAVALLRQTPNIDPKRVYVLGHSLGGMVAPRLAATDSNIAGIILLAGAARPLEDVVIDQLNYISSLPGPNGEGAKELLLKMKEQLARVKDPKLLAEMPDSEKPLGMPAKYWISLRSLDPAPTAGKLNCRVLVLQADRDYQVTLEDFSLFEKALAGKPKATLKRFANLNHLFMEGTGKATPAEYEKTGHVAGEVIDTIADWLK